MFKQSKIYLSVFIFGVGAFVSISGLITCNNSSHQEQRFCFSSFSDLSKETDQTRYEKVNLKPVLLKSGFIMGTHKKYNEYILCENPRVIHKVIQDKDYLLETDSLLLLDQIYSLKNLCYGDLINKGKIQKSYNPSFYLVGIFNIKISKSLYYLLLFEDKTQNKRLGLWAVLFEYNDKYVMSYRSLYQVVRSYDITYLCDYNNDLKLDFISWLYGKKITFNHIESDNSFKEDMSIPVSHIGSFYNSKNTLDFNNSEILSNTFPRLKPFTLDTTCLFNVLTNEYIDSLDYID